jgi:GTP cyclohydrolase I
MSVPATVLSDQALLDVQSQPDARGMAINRVGVRDLRYPITVMDRASGWQHTIARISLSVSLPPQHRGTHMSRFLEVLNQHRGELTIRTVPLLLGDLKQRLHAEDAQLEVRFPYFVERRAPVTGAAGMMDYDCGFNASTVGERLNFAVTVCVPVTSLCPCSKEISDYGAHNQRGYVNLEIRPRDGADERSEIVWIEELIELAETSASSPVYSLLKRPDERHVTMQAFDKPAFVEDIVRDVAARLREDSRISYFRVDAVNHESIHNHSAFAEIESGHS